MRSKRLGWRSACARRMRAHIIGTTVSETTAEITIVTASVTANSLNRRPITPPMNSSGISTAISETVSERMVKPICPAPSSAASQRRLALLQIAHDVLDHHDRIVDHEAGGDDQRHQREVVDRVVELVHHRQRADQRDRHGDARDDGRRHVAQEHEDHQHHQHDRQHQLERGVGDRGADHAGAVGDDCDLHACRQRRFELRQLLLDLVDRGDHVRARLALHIEHDRRRVVVPGALLDVLRAPG